MRHDGLVSHIVGDQRRPASGAYGIRRTVGFRRASNFQIGSCVRGAGQTIDFLTFEPVRRCDAGPLAPMARFTPWQHNSSVAAGYLPNRYRYRIGLAITAFHSFELNTEQN